MKVILQAVAAAALAAVASGSPVDGAAEQPQQQPAQQPLPGLHKVDFTLKAGNQYADASADKKPRFVKRDTVDAEIENENSFYLIDLGIGTDNETIGILLDTGSSDLWVMSSENPYCASGSSSSSKQAERALARGVREKSMMRAFHKRASSDGDDGDDGGETGSGGGAGGGPPEIATTSGGDIATEVATVASSEATIDCSEYGTLDLSSSSFTSNDTEFAIQYADYTYAYGTWGYDDVSFAGITVKDLSFAVANESNSTIGVLGIGLTGSETTYSGTFGSSYTYANLPVKMVEQGLISKAAYSLYLNSSDASTGSVLFGGVDHDKYSGTLGLMPIINTLTDMGYSSAIRLEVTLSAVYIPIDDADESFVITTTKSPALLDSGTTLTYVPDAIAIKIGEALGASYESSVGAYVMECLDDSNTTTVQFDFSGAVISVPVTDLLVEISGTSSGSYCAVGVLTSGDDSYILGASFLKSAYVVYDLDDMEIAMAQANLESDGEQLEAIVSAIPSATSVSGYSETWSSTAYDTATALTYTTGVISNTSSSSSSSGSSSSSSSSGSSSGSSAKDSGASALQANALTLFVAAVTCFGLVAW